MEASNGSRGPTAVAEGYYLSHVVYHLHRRGLLDRLREPASTSELAADLKVTLSRFKVIS